MQCSAATNKVESSHHVCLESILMNYIIRFKEECGCDIGRVFVSVFAYADDIVLP